MKHNSTESVVTTWGLTASGVMLSQIHQILGIVVLLASLAYTAWRWHRDIKNGR